VRQDPAALGYLHEIANDGAVPYVAPIEIFERAWPLWNLALIGPLDDETLALCQPHLDFLKAEWKPGEGIASAEGLTLLDGDDTGLTYEVLVRFSRSVDLEGVLHYEENERFRCYALEANPSVSTNVHVLGALRQAGFEVQHPSVQKVLRFLRQMQTLRLFWFDKWHASPYYPTAHAVITCTGYDDDLVYDAACWIMETQNLNGSWGYYMPTAEETAYCLQALIFWKRNGGQVPGDVLKRGATWLADHTEPPYPPLWIGKCLYCPVLVVRSAILSALMLIAQEG
jgi:halimadienyl-diphosphate synthase